MPDSRSQPPAFSVAVDNVILQPVKLEDNDLPSNLRAPRYSQLSFASIHIPSAPRFRSIALPDHRPFLGEYIASVLFFFLGLGLNAQLRFRHSELDAFSLGWIAWGTALALTIYTAFNASGAHMNPAFTLTLTIHRKFPWRKALGYGLVQVLGAFTASALVYALFYPEFSRDPQDSLSAANSTAGVFYMIPLAGRSHWSDVFGECLATVLFFVIVLATGEPNSFHPAVMPAIVGAALPAVGMATGNYTFNPARDLGPRLFSACVYGPGVFAANGFYFFVPIVGPLLGAVLAGLVHDHCLRAKPSL